MDQEFLTRGFHMDTCEGWALVPSRTYRDLFHFVECVLPINDLPHNSVLTCTHAGSDAHAIELAEILIKGTCKLCVAEHRDSDPRSAPFKCGALA